MGSISDNFDLGPYDDGHRIDNGSFAEVFRYNLKDKKLSNLPQTVVVKVLLNVNDKDSYLREVEIMKKLRDDDNANNNYIVKLLGLLDKEPEVNRMRFVMENCDYNLENFAPRDEDDKLIAAMQIIGALKYVHERCIVHMDIAPKNILVQTPFYKEDHVTMKLADFGLSHECTKDSRGHKVEKKLFGTPDYRAPELKQSGDYEGKNHFKLDIYSLGKVFRAKLFKEEETLDDEGLPEINDMIKSMIEFDPNVRPSIEVVHAPFKARYDRLTLQKDVRWREKPKHSASTPVSPMDRQISVKELTNGSLSPDEAALRTAVFQGQGKTVEYILDKKKTSRFLDSYRRNQFHYAMLSSCDDIQTKENIVEALINNNPDWTKDFNAKDVDGVSPFWLAVKTKYMHIFEHIEEIDWSAVEKRSNKSLLHLICESSAVPRGDDRGDTDDESQNLEVIREHLCSRLTPNSKGIKEAIDLKSNQHGFTALHLTVINDIEVVFDKLLELGAKVNVQDKEQKNPLWHAVHLGRFAYCEKLLSESADVTIQSKEKLDSLQLAFINDNKDIAELLLKNVTSTYCEETVCESSNFDGLPISALASLSNHAKVVEILLQMEPELVTKEFQRLTEKQLKSTAVHCAAFNGHTEILSRLIIDIGDNLKDFLFQPDYYSVSPIRYAIMYGHLDSVDAMLSTSNAFYLEEEIQKRLLEYAMRDNSLKIFKYFIEKFELTDVNWMLDFAIQMRTLSIMRELVQELHVPVTHEHVCVARECLRITLKYANRRAYSDLSELLPFLEQNLPQEPQRERIQVQTDTVYVDDRDDFHHYYRLNNEAPGLVLFFYQTQRRSGWQSDLEIIKYTFRDCLRCEFGDFADFSSVEFRNKIEGLQPAKLNIYKYVILIIAAHGVDGGLQVRDNDVLPISEVEEKFKNLPQTCPKALIFNTCRANTGTRHGEHPQGHYAEDEKREWPLFRRSPVDYLILYSCDEGYFSWRKVEEGSHFIQLFCRELLQYSTVDLEQLIKNINRDNRLMDPDGLVFPYYACLRRKLRLTDEPIERPKLTTQKSMDRFRFIRKHVYD